MTTSASHASLWGMRASVPGCDRSGRASTSGASAQPFAFATAALAATLAATSAAASASTIAFSATANAIAAAAFSAVSFATAFFHFATAFSAVSLAVAALASALSTLASALTLVASALGSCLVAAALVAAHAISSALSSALAATSAFAIALFASANAVSTLTAFADTGVRRILILEAPIPRPFLFEYNLRLILVKVVRFPLFFVLVFRIYYKQIFYNIFIINDFIFMYINGYLL
jgi:hypothetical protein